MVIAVILELGIIVAGVNTTRSSNSYDTNITKVIVVIVGTRLEVILV